MEDTAQKVDSRIAGWKNYIKVNIMWKSLHFPWTVFCRVKWVYYREIYVEVTAKHVDSVIVAWMECVTVNIMSKILHSTWT